MSSLAIKLSFPVARADLHVIAAEEVKSLTSFETDVVDHWQFDNTTAALTGRKIGKRLLPQSNTHSFTANSVVLKNQSGQGLLSEIDDMQVMTQAVIMKWQDIVTAAKSQVLCGALNQNVGDGGSAVYLASGSPGVPVMNVRGGTSASQVAGLGAVAFGKYIFVAGVEGLDNPGTQTLIIFTGGIGSQSYGPYPAADKVLATGGRKIGVGNCHYVSATFQGGPDIEVAEYMLWDKAKSVAELNAIYARAKARLASKGMALF